MCNLEAHAARRLLKQALSGTALSLPWLSMHISEPAFCSSHMLTAWKCSLGGVPGAQQHTHLRAQHDMVQTSCCRPLKPAGTQRGGAACRVFQRLLDASGVGLRAMYLPGLQGLKQQLRMLEWLLERIMPALKDHLQVSADGQLDFAPSVASTLEAFRC